MPLAAAGISAAGSLLGGITGGKGATRAAKIQADAAKAGIAEQRDEFNKIQANEKPYQDAGSSALSSMLDLLGLGTSGAGGQQSAIDALKASPAFTSLFRQGNDTILQDASATGGLRGGNTQNSLANFGSSLLAQQIQQRLGALGGLVGVGQAGAAGTNAAATNTGNAISTLLGQQGAASAGGTLGAATSWQNALNGVGKLLGGTGLTSLFGSNTPVISNPNVDLSGIKTNLAW